MWQNAGRWGIEEFQWSGRQVEERTLAESRQRRERDGAVARGRGLVKGMFPPPCFKGGGCLCVARNDPVEGKIKNAGEAR